jgi:hypothetical protein
LGDSPLLVLQVAVSFECTVLAGRYCACVLRKEGVFFFNISLATYNPVGTTSDLCFVLHNDDGKGGHKMERRKASTTNKGRKLRK